MTPEELVGNRKVQTVSISAGAEIIYDADGQPAVLQMTNPRGPIEVFVTSEKKAEYLPILLGADDMTLTGFFRRRSSRNRDRYIWCLILFTAEASSAPVALAA